MIVGLDKEIVKDRKRLANTYPNKVKWTVFNSIMYIIVGEVIQLILFLYKNIPMILIPSQFVVQYCVEDFL